MITTAAQIEDLVKELKNHEMISFDTEFIRENTFFPQLEIIQVATQNQSWIIDAAHFLKNGRDALSPFWDVMRDSKILKIAHAIQGDQEAIFSAFGVLATPTFDTAIAASLCGLGEAIGLGNLLKAKMDIQLKKGHSRTNWAVRPLPEQLIEYAHLDVKYLVDLTRILMSDLERLGRKEWTLKLCAKLELPEAFEESSEEIAERLSSRLARGGKVDPKAYSVLKALVDWREARVRKLNIPKRWVADDSVLGDLATTRPKNLEHLSHFRGLSRGEVKNQGDYLLKIISEAYEVAADSVPRHTRFPAPSSNESQVMELLKTFVGILADHHQIASKHLMTTSQLLPVIRARASSPKDWAEKGLITAEAAALVGDAIFDFLHGKRSLSVKNGQVSILES